MMLVPLVMLVTEMVEVDLVEDALDLLRDMVADMMELPARTGYLGECRSLWLIHLVKIRRK